MTVDVLLEIFDCYLLEDNRNYDRWHNLVHVCRRWRCIISASPRRLHLKLYCTRRRPVNSMLDIWPALPIVIVSKNMTSKEDVAIIISALRQHNRVYRIYYRSGQYRDSFSKKFAVIDKPYPVLTSLRLHSDQRQNVPVLPKSFLGGSAPCLRSLTLDGISYPSVGRLLSSTTNLVQLSLWHIPHSRYIAPETIIPSLSTLSRLLDSNTLDPGPIEQGSRRPRSHV